MGDKLPPLTEKKRRGDDEGGNEGKWKPQNWKKVNDSDLRRMAPQQRSKYFAYEEAPKDIAESQEETRKRLREKKKQILREHDLYSIGNDERTEREKQERLIGQLKAAEARNRIRIMRLRYETNRGQEVNHLISCQPNARKAVRLQALLPVRNQDKLGSDILDKLSRGRVEALLEDSQGLITGRT